MVRAVVILAVACFALGACSERAVCPAFQSAYIHDKEALRKKFSYFQEDSTPKILTASKDRYLVAQPVPYRKKVRQMRTVEMKPVPVVVPDSLTADSSEVTAEELDRAARSVMDSTFIPDVSEEQAALASADDSVYMITVDREARVLRYNGADSLEYDPATNRYVAQKPKYYVEHVGLNIDQDNYMWYLRDYIVLPDVKLARAQEAADRVAEVGAERREERKGTGIKGFFNRLFGKKTESDSTETVPQEPEQNYDFINLDTLTLPVEPTPDPQDEPVMDPQSDFFGPVPTPDPQDEPPVQDPAIPAQPREEDDGF